MHKCQYLWPFDNCQGSISSTLYFPGFQDVPILWPATLYTTPMKFGNRGISDNFLVYTHLFFFTHLVFFCSCIHACHELVVYSQSTFIFFRRSGGDYIRLFHLSVFFGHSDFWSSRFLLIAIFDQSSFLTIWNFWPIIYFCPFWIFCPFRIFWPFGILPNSVSVSPDSRFFTMTEHSEFF